MNEYKSSNINWLNIIIIKDFQSYVDLGTLKEVSILSKLVREKLKPELFQHISLRNNKLIFICNSNHDNIFMEFYKCFYLQEYDINLPLNRKYSNIQNGLNEISSDLISIRKYAKSFNLDGLDRSGYYIYSITNNFHNLKFLELRGCFIPYLEFARIGESLPNLTSVKLIYLYFTILPANNIILDNFIFPQKLNYLEICGCRLNNPSSLSDPYKFLFNEDATQDFSTSFIIPNICVPSLKHLVFFTYYTQDSRLEEFLKTNPNLESLHIESYNLPAIKSLNSLNTLEICDDISFDGRSTVHCLNFLKRLEIEIQGNNNYDNINNFCTSCYNLEYLHITLRNIGKLQQLIDTCITPIIANLSILKTLQLTIHKEEHDTIDISKFNKIENLKIKSSSETLFNIEFASCSNLKNIELTSYSGYIDNSEFKYKFTSYKNWIFKYFKHTIRGLKFNK